MEYKEKIVIKLDELPSRTEKLSPDEVSSVFGGCNGSGESCNSMRCGDCCDGTKCLSGTNGDGVCI